MSARSLTPHLALALMIGIDFMGTSSISRAAEKLDPSKLPEASKAAVDFVRDVQPLLRKNCYSCHGSEHQEGGLRLDQKKRALDGGDNGAVLIPGKSGESRLLYLVAGLDDETGQMPPDGKGTPLVREQVALLRAWIDQGAKWPEGVDVARAADHWAFGPIRRSPLPTVKNTAWLRNSIDAFILARLESQQIQPSPEASRETLLRRLHLDLLGLPPTPDEVRAFAQDERPDAYERLVDRLLASPHFGERWGRHWLDLARYADSDGYEKDQPRPFAWRYRNWVIEALNADLPFDRFSRLQIAGDLLPKEETGARIAAGFHRNTLHNTEGGADPEEDRVKKTIDRTNTLGTIWLGLTVGCAQCHSHKYDPISQREYFSLYAFFNSLNEVNIEAPTPEQAARHAEATRAFAAEQARLKQAVKDYEDQQLAAAQTAWEERARSIPLDDVPADIIVLARRPKEGRSPEEERQVAEFYRGHDPGYLKLRQAASDHAKQSPKLDEQAKAQSVAQLSSPRATKIHLRGDFLSPGETVEPATPAVLPPLGLGGARPDRLDLTNWLFDPANPLTARVAANRLWQQIFGRGLVATSDDFGKQGELPSHPELLDTLAAELQGGGWSQKQVLRLIVTSATYRQSSAVRADVAEIDPENALLARQNRRRVEAELIRDLALAAGGLLEARIGGPSVRPPQPAEYASVTYAGSARWDASKGGDRYRRGMYTFFQRTSPYPMLMTFDSPDSNECTARRSRSNTPLQSLTLWNDPVFFEAAQSLARRILRDSPAGDADETTVASRRAAYAFELCLGRAPQSRELATLVELYRTQLRACERDAKVAAVIAGTQSLPPGESISAAAAWTIVGRTLLNLDEFITRD